MTPISSFFDSEEEKMCAQTEELQKALTHLRYEGKLLKDQNLKFVQILVYGLDSAIERHRCIQEKIVFPFLQTHIPRHEAAILLLKAEHAEIKNHQERLKRDLLEISSASDSLQEARIYEDGIYLATLLRHHIGLEKKSIGQSLQKELREDEKKVMADRVEVLLRRNK